MPSTMLFELMSSVQSDAATITGTPWLSTMPVANLLNRKPGKLARTSSLTSISITMQLATARAWNGIFIGNHNGTSAATMRVRAAQTEGNLTAAPGLDTTALSMWPATGRPTDEEWEPFNSCRRFTNSTAYLWWRVDIADPANPAGYFQAGRIIGATRYQPTFNYTPEVAIGYAPADLRNESQFGYTDTQARRRPRVARVPFDAITEADAMTKMLEIQRRIGGARDAFIMLDADATDHFHRMSFLAYMTAASPLGYRQFGVYMGNLEFKENL